LRGTVHYPVIQGGEVDCPKEGCGGSIEVDGKGKKICGRCRTKVHLYRRRRQVVRMTFHTNDNNRSGSS